MVVACFRVPGYASDFVGAGTPEERDLRATVLIKSNLDATVFGVARNRTLDDVVVQVMDNRAENRLLVLAVCASTDT